MCLAVRADHVDENQCYVKLKWKAPDRFKSENGEYRLQVRDSQKNYVPLVANCRTLNDQMECTVPMSTFIGAPVYLRESEPILVKVLPFINFQWGPEFDVDTRGAKVMRPPQWMELPRAEALSMNAV
jgi:hypothetical protein